MLPDGGQTCSRCRIHLACKAASGCWVFSSCPVQVLWLHSYPTREQALLAKPGSGQQTAWMNGHQIINQHPLTGRVWACLPAAWLGWAV